MRKICLLLLLATLSCCSQQPPHDPRQVLHLNLSDDPVALDPRTVRSLKDLTIVKQLFEGLMRLDSQGIPQPAIAQSIETSEDLLTYTFHLKKTYWNNGDPLTAYDFEYAWKKVIDPAFVSDYAYMLSPVEKFIAVDEQTLIVTLKEYTPYFLELTAFPTYFPVHRHIAETHAHWSIPSTEHFVCNGPFCLNRWIPQTEIILEKNPTYWDRAAVKLDQIAFSVISDNHTESLLFEKNQLDWLGQPLSNNISSELLGKMKQSDKLDSYEVAGTLWFTFNISKEPFDNPNIRKAFGYAVNRADIITHILQGDQMPATGVLPPCMAAHLEPYFIDGDTQKACSFFQQGLSEKGWTRETFPKVTLNYAPSERATKIVQLVQQQWQKVLGVSIELQALEKQVYERSTKRGLHQVGLGQWIADFNDPLAFLEIFKFKIDAAKGTGINDTGWENAVYTSLLDASLHEQNPLLRTNLLNHAEGILVEEMPIAPLYHYVFDYIKKPYVRDVVLSPLGIADFKTTHIFGKQN